MQTHLTGYVIALVLALTGHYPLTPLLAAQNPTSQPATSQPKSPRPEARGSDGLGTLEG